jgi:hypothetical protein
MSMIFAAGLSLAFSSNDCQMTNLGGDAAAACL